MTRDERVRVYKNTNLQKEKALPLFLKEEST